jgi:phenylpropionate dioxygenase-like ring-hydroxylating dioxygenase large terminal subunit
MGAALREYWMPAFLAWEVEADGAPLRVRLLGEQLVAYRDTSGKVGLTADACPHRGASMFFGRNEETALRCVYHGWKFDAEGTCVDMPNEPVESNFKHKIRIQTYPCVERNGIVFAYLGPRATPPDLPRLAWLDLPKEHVHVSMRMQLCNWAQAVEGGIDSSHISFLHSWLRPAERPMPGGNRGTLPLYTATDKHPHFEVVDTAPGVLIGARRAADAANYYWRITQFLAPFYTYIPGSMDPAANIGGHAWVPMDDEHTMTWSITWNYARPITAEEHAAYESFPGGGIHYGHEGMKPATTQPGGKWVPALCTENDFGRDWELQRTKLYIGIEQFGTQDSAIQETMGAIYDRTKEHLGGADTAIIQYRRRMINAARALQSRGVHAARRGRAGGLLGALSLAAVA